MNFLRSVVHLSVTSSSGLSGASCENWLHKPAISVQPAVCIVVPVSCSGLALCSTTQLYRQVYVAVAVQSSKHRQPRLARLALCSRQLTSFTCFLMFDFGHSIEQDWISFTRHYQQEEDVHFDFFEKCRNLLCDNLP